MEVQAIHVHIGSTGQSPQEVWERNSKPSYGRAGERVLEVPKQVLKDVSRKG